MATRCSSALSEKRRDGVVQKISSSIAARLVKGGHALGHQDMLALMDAVSALYRDVSTPVVGLTTQPFGSRSMSPLDGRPASAAAVSQRQIEDLVGEFSRRLQERKEKPIPTLHPVEQPRDKPCRPLPLAPTALVEASDNAHISSSPLPSVGGSFDSPSPTRRTFQGSPALSLSRSSSSLRSTADIMLGKIGDSPLPATKRLRRVMRDADDFQTALMLASAEKNDNEERRRKKLESSLAFREALDLQCDVKIHAQQLLSDQAQRERLQLEEEAAEYKQQVRLSSSLKREKLSTQKTLNEVMRIEAEERRKEEKKRIDEEASQEVSDIHAEDTRNKRLEAERRVCQTNMMTQQLKDIQDHKRQLKQGRIDELRQSKVRQKQADDIYAAQEQKRVEHKNLTLVKIRAGEARANRQYENIADKMSDEQRKEAWLAKKLARESQEISLKAQARNEREIANRDAAKGLTKHCLLQQIAAHNAQKIEEKNRDFEWASELQSALAMQDSRDAMRRVLHKEESRDWVQLLDAQNKLREYQEVTDIVTSIPRGPTPTGVIASPTRSQRSGM